MARATQRYMTQEISDAERMATFAVRRDTLNTILDRLRADAGTAACNSFHIVGPRGSGKTTLLHMVRQSVDADSKLAAHYWPVILPEEQVAAASLRDFLSAILEQAQEDGSQDAARWRKRCEDETDDDRSAALAEEGLRALREASGRLLLIGVENFDRVLSQTLSSDAERAVLRRLMIDRPILCLLATSTTLHPNSDRYDDPLFGHLLTIDLPRLRDPDIDSLLRTYATYRNERAVLARLDSTRGIVRSLSRLAGGNPRLVLMLYDVISIKDIDTAVDALRLLLDEMTPLYNGLLDRLAAGPRKVLDAMMRAGGTAQPAEITKAVRGMKLTEVTSHLRRLKQDGYVVLHKGGKGRSAYYSASDRFFGTWYQMRYLRAGRRRIELFVEALKAWFSPRERLTALRQRVKPTRRLDTISSDYLLYSMSGTRHFRPALATFLASADERRRAGDSLAAIIDYTRVIDLPDAPAEDRAMALVNRGATYGNAGDSAAAIADYTIVIDMSGAAAEQRSMALVNRGDAHRNAGDSAAAIADYTCVIDMPDAPAEQLARALVGRGIAHGNAGDNLAEISDYTCVVDMPEAPPEERDRALINRGATYSDAGDSTAAIADYTHVIDVTDASAEDRAWALVNRGVAHGNAGDSAAAIADYTRVIDMPEAPAEQRARALVGRGAIYGDADDSVATIADCTRVIDMAEAPPEERARALFNRGLAHAMTDDAETALLDWEAYVSLAPVAEVASDAIALLRSLARPSLKVGWTDAFEKVRESLPLDHRDILSPLKLVADRLNGAPEAEFDRQPPEVREFVREVLDSFEKPPVR